MNSLDGMSIAAAGCCGAGSSHVAGSGRGSSRRGSRRGHCTHHIPNLGGAVPAAQCSDRHANMNSSVRAATQCWPWRRAVGREWPPAGRYPPGYAHPPREQDVWALEVEVGDALGVEEHQAPRHIQRNLRSGRRRTQRVLEPASRSAEARRHLLVAVLPSLRETPAPPLAPPTFLPRRYQLTLLAAMLCSRSPPSMYSVTSIVWSGPKYAPCAGQGQHR
jgi:hypothetical protein